MPLLLAIFLIPGCSEKRGLFVSPQREIVEYFHFLYAILDDTDLLSKISIRDVNCIAELINRLKTLMLGKEVEVIDLDDIPHDENFKKTAAKRILQNDEMYSLYRKVYLAKEKAHRNEFKACGRWQTIFYFR